MTGCHYNVDRLSLFAKEGKSQKYIPDFDRREMELYRPSGFCGFRKKKLKQFGSRR